MSRASRLGVRALASLGVAVLTVQTASGAHATESVESGWWTTAPAPLAPDAPAGALVVQGGAPGTDASSYAAISFALSPGEAPSTLRLHVLDGSITTPGTVLRLCPLTAPFDPDEGGAAEDAPTYSCEQEVESGPPGDGATYDFALDELDSGGDASFAVLPTAPTDRVVLRAPVVDDLAVRPPTPGDPPGAAGPAEPLGAPGAPARVAPRPAASAPMPSSRSSMTGGAPPVRPAPATPAEKPEAGIAAPTPLASAPVDASSSTLGRWLLVLVAAAAAGAAWWRAGTIDPRRTSLLSARGS